ncbi:MAG TPA: hypothetical protein VHE13_15520 [Opitutus sp.]|nr:hypothetical protein [Opitutus sp.]
MGFFDRFAQKKPAPAPAAVPEPAAAATDVRPRLVAARERLEAKDRDGAVAIYEEVLAEAGDRGDVLLTISADLGVTGHVREIVELIAPRYDAERHGAATGLNLVQAYLALNDAAGAQHLLDVLFALNQPEIEERLHGFGNAIAELVHAQQTGQALPAEEAVARSDATNIKLVSISKPIWFYGLEPLAAQILPEKAGALRRVAFAQLALLGVPDVAELAKQPEEELGRLCRALPLWLAETFYFSPHYAPRAAVGLLDGRYALFPREWTVENLRQLVETTEEGLDYIFTGALRRVSDDYELLLRVWDVRKFRERKQFVARWAPATADAELAKLHEQIRLFMEWSPDRGALAYAPPASPRAWLEMLGASVSLFLAEKGLVPPESIPPVDDVLARTAAAAAGSEAASLAFLTLRNRAEKLQLAARLDAALASSPLIAEAQGLG